MIDCEFTNFTFVCSLENQSFHFQLQLIEDDFETLEEKDLEFFFTRDKPILGWNGLPHPNPKVKKKYLYSFCQTIATI